MASDGIKQRVLVKTEAYHFDGELHNFVGRRSYESHQCGLAPCRTLLLITQIPLRRSILSEDSSV